MSDLLYESRDGEAKGQSKVYITCHPCDVKFLEDLRKIIVNVADCTVYFTKDAKDKQFEGEHASNLEYMNLFVFIVTERLLTEPCAAMDRELILAKREKIPILPIMVEDGLDELYSRPDAFGERHYLKWNNDDLTAVAFEDKLSLFLSSTLIDSELTKRVRAAFDAYVFLSYRKKDREYANRLMRLIHSNPLCRDIAIWYDEFLTPGESFNDNIRKMLKDSSLFTLLVTPNILEKSGGKPNFVVAEEYPAAKESGVPIIAAEMQKTDREMLKKAFYGLPECISPDDAEEFFERFTETLSFLAVKENDGDAEHNFLIGLAYLEGIDVEIDRARGLSLIESSAEAGLAEAMEKLYFMYYNGQGVDCDYDKGLYWCERAYERVHELYGENDPPSINAAYNLASAYAQYGKDDKAREYYELTYSRQRSTLGEAHQDTIRTMEELGPIYHYLGLYDKEINILDKRWEICERVYGASDPHNLSAIYDMARCYDRLSTVCEPKNAFLSEAVKLYESLYKVFTAAGIKTVGTVGWLNFYLSSAYKRLGNLEKSREYDNAAISLITDPNKKDKDGKPMDEIDQIKELLGFDLD